MDWRLTLERKDKLAEKSHSHIQGKGLTVGLIKKATMTLKSTSREG